MLEQVFGLVLTVSFSLAYVPQIIKIIKRKSSDDVSLMMLLINGLGYYCGLGYVLIKEVSAFWLIFNYSMGFIMTGLCIVIWFCYRKSPILFWRKNNKKVNNVKKI